MIPTQMLFGELVQPMKWSINIDGTGNNGCGVCMYSDTPECETAPCTEGKDVYYVKAEMIKVNEKRTLKDSACAIILSKDGKVLTTTRRNTDILCLPGGKVDEGETILDAIMREVAEETGFHLNRSKMQPIYSEIVLGSDLRDFYCTTFVYSVPFDADDFENEWAVEDGIKVRFTTWNELLEHGTFVVYNKMAWHNLSKWQLSNKT